MPPVCPRRGEGAADIRYLTVKGGLGELRELGLLDGIRAMANRVYAGQSWWVAGHRSSIECLYRNKLSRACPTTFVIAIAAGTEGTNTLTGREETEKKTVCAAYLTCHHSILECVPISPLKRLCNYMPGAPNFVLLYYFSASCVLCIIRIIIYLGFLLY